ncbi:MAG: hypothetical protein E7653_06120 [Ruminococcaceae bacterium]|nr:hypothetical protein [Oscillospiraceae bacterium]
MNTVDFGETAVVENDLARECILHGVGTLGRGRRPFAKAQLKGEAHMSGTASFYYTPLGMLVCVTVKGLSDKGVYTLSLASNDGSKEVQTRCAIPPLYSRGGYAWCSALTGKLAPSEIQDKTLIMREMDAKNDKQVAIGAVRKCVNF